MAAMRNDARPVGPETDDQSPLSEQHSHDVVNRDRHDRVDAFRHLHGDSRGDLASSDDADPTMPSDDSTLNTNI